jgi:hypothetical protein
VANTYPGNPRGTRLGAAPRPARAIPQTPRADEEVADPTLPRHWVDHGIHRRRALSSLVLSATGSSDQLDPHPDLIRAAKHHGEDAGRPCPWCRSEALVLLRYVYSDELGPFSGRLRTEPELREWAVQYGFLDVYVVEVCPDCKWNHLLHTYVVGDGRQRSPRRAPADLLE